MLECAAGIGAAGSTVAPINTPLKSPALLAASEIRSPARNDSPATDGERPSVGQA